MSKKKIGDKSAYVSKMPSTMCPELAKYKKEEFLTVIQKWDITGGNKRILKTDLYEEAFGEDEILFAFAKENNKKMAICAIDICEETVRQAKEKMISRGFKHDYMTADVRSLPFGNDVFDFILSTSTLDHFKMLDDVKKSLAELKRVLKPGGEIIIALHNIWNFSFYLSCKLSRFLRVDKYPSIFFGPQGARDICKESGLRVEKEVFLVHIFFPLNKLIILLRRFFPDFILDNFVSKMTTVFKLAGGVKKTNIFTAWFIAVQCRK